MRRRWSALWKRLERAEPGERFQTFYRDQQDQSLPVKVAFCALAIACFAAGMVLLFVPGPAILFFALGGALLGTQSLWVARGLDGIEVRAQKTLDSIRRRWPRR